MTKEFLECYRTEEFSVDEKQRVYRTLVERLPTPTRLTLFILLQFLVDVSLKKEQNSMTANNLGIVFGPNLLREEGEGGGLAGLRDLSGPSGVVTEMIELFEGIKKLMEESVR